MDRFKYLLENNLFGVCTKLGEKLSLSPTLIRKYFIYASFFTLGSPVILYLTLAFWIEVRKTFRRNHQPSVWEFE